MFERNKIYHISFKYSFPSISDCSCKYEGVAYIEYCRLFYFFLRPIIPKYYKNQNHGKYFEKYSCNSDRKSNTSIFYVLQRKEIWNNRNCFSKIDIREIFCKSIKCDTSEYEENICFHKRSV